jgi:hypothetical protein
MFRWLAILALALAAFACTVEYSSPPGSGEGQGGSTMGIKQLDGDGNGSSTGIESVTGTVDPVEADGETPKPEPTTETTPTDEVSAVHCDLGAHEVAGTKYKTYDSATGFTTVGYYWDVSQLNFDSGAAIVGCQACWRSKLGMPPK